LNLCTQEKEGEELFDRLRMSNQNSLDPRPAFPPALTLELPAARAVDIESFFVARDKKGEGTLQTLRAISDIRTHTVSRGMATPETLTALGDMLANVQVLLEGIDTVEKISPRADFDKFPLKYTWTSSFISPLYPIEYSSFSIKFDIIMVLTCLWMTYYNQAEQMTGDLFTSTIFFADSIERDTKAGDVSLCLVNARRVLQYIMAEEKTYNNQVILPPEAMKRARESFDKHIVAKIGLMAAIQKKRDKLSEFCVNVADTYGDLFNVLSSLIPKKPIVSEKILLKLTRQKTFYEAYAHYYRYKEIKSENRSLAITYLRNIFTVMKVPEEESDNEDTDPDPLVGLEKADTEFIAAVRDLIKYEALALSTLGESSNVQYAQIKPFRYTLSHEETEWTPVLYQLGVRIPALARAAKGKNASTGIDLNLN
jgi:hypothetical protein